MGRLNIDKQFFDENGYLLIKNVFTKEEIQKIREKTYDQYEIDKKKDLTFSLPNPKVKAKFAKGDLLSKENLYTVLTDDRILEIARTILGSDELVYFGDSSYQIGTGFRGFHRDNIDRTDLNGPDWQGEYTLVRMGIYMQDHKNYSGGLKVKQGSHKNADGKTVFIDSEVGDVVIWSLKTLHSGNAVRLKWFPNLAIQSGYKESLIPAFLKKDQQYERISFFMTYALESSHLNHYIQEYTLKRDDAMEHARKSIHDDSVKEYIKQKSIRLLDPLA